MAIAVLFYIVAIALIVVGKNANIRMLLLAGIAPLLTGGALTCYAVWSLLHEKK